MYFDVTTLFLYILMGLIPTVFLNFSIKKRNKRLFFVLLFIWWFVWTGFVGLREVSYNIGGVDALDYLNYFDVSLEDNLSYRYSSHFEPFFRFVTRLIRSLTSNRFIYFIIIYGFVNLSYILFLYFFTSQNTVRFTYVLSFIPIMLGFCSLRSCLAISILLLALILLYKNKLIFSAILFVLTVFVQKGMVFALPLFFFYLYYKTKTISLKWFFVFFMLSIIGGILMRNFFINYFSDLIEISYIHYAERSINNYFFVNFWKLCFGQFLSFLIFAIYRNKINDKSFSATDIKKFNFMSIIFAYDILLIPISYLFNVYREYQYFFLVRIVLLAYIAYSRLHTFKSNNRRVWCIVLYLIAIFWFIVYFVRYYDVSYISPYRFGLFSY